MRRRDFIALSGCGVADSGAGADAEKPVWFAAHV